MKTKVSLAKCENYDSNEVMRAVSSAIDNIGGIKNFVKPGERILLKPNLLSARQPERAVTTHPEIVRAVIRLVREAGAVPILGDSPGGAVKGVERVWKETGMKMVSEQEKVELVNFETSGSDEVNINHPLLPRIHLSKIALNVDGIINLPKLKTHGLVIFTGAIKNFYGCIPGLRKAEYHKIVPHPDDFGRLLGELYLLLKSRVRLTVMDGILGMEGNGPGTGDVRKLNIVAASQDVVALDTVITSLLGFKPQKIEMIKYLSAAKAGESNLSRIEITGESPSAFDLAHFKFPSNWYIILIPHFLISMLGKFIWMKPEIVPEICENCMMCVNSCPVKAISKKGKEKPVINAKACISCLCCHELCQYKAIELRSSFLAKLLIRH